MGFVCLYFKVCLDKAACKTVIVIVTRATGPRAQWAIPFPHLLRERDRK